MTENLEYIKIRHLKSDKLQYGANESSDRNEKGEPRYIRITDLNEDGSLRADTFRTLPQEVAQPYLLRDGDILLARSGATVGKSFIYYDYYGKACFAGYLICLRLNKIKAFPKFIWYYTQSLIYKQEIDLAIIQATIQNVSAEKYGEFRVPIPSLETQKLIATFLDRKTAAIDTLIAKKQRLIQLLEEKRTALINQAATKGLNPNVSMKSTGVEWLEEVPTHWDVMAIKYLAHSGRKTFIDGDWVELPYITEEGIRLIQTGNVGIGNYREKGFKYIAEESFHKLTCTEVKPNDVLICRLDGPVGRACLAPNLGLRMITSVDNTILKPATKHNARFIVYLLSCKSYLEWNQVLCRVGGGNRWRVSRSMLGDLRVPVPPEKVFRGKDSKDPLND